MIGEKLREARQNRQLSLTQVAAKAHISAATLSRIENAKQALDVDMLLMLAKILAVAPEALIGGGPAPDQQDAELADRISGLRPSARAKLWRDLAAQRKSTRGRRRDSQDLAPRIEELLAQVDFLRQEIDAVRTRLKRK